MRFISTKFHGILDYLVGIILIVAPWLPSFNRGGAAIWVPVTLGIITLLYSLLTDYEFGLIKVLHMPTHLALDFLSGLLLAGSPWIFGFSDRIYLPHLILGIFEVLAAATTQMMPGYKTNKKRN